MWGRRAIVQRVNSKQKQTKEQPPAISSSVFAGGLDVNGRENSVGPAARGRMSRMIYLGLFPNCAAPPLPAPSRPVPASEPARHDSPQHIFTVTFHNSSTVFVFLKKRKKERKRGGYWPIHIALSTPGSQAERRDSGAAASKSRFFVSPGRIQDRDCGGRSRWRSRRRTVQHNPSPSDSWNDLSRSLPACLIRKV